MSADITTRDGLFAVMRQFAAEREAAKPLVAELLAREELPWDEEIPESWKTLGFVEELTKGAAKVVEREPHKCADLLRYATAVVFPIAEPYPRVATSQIAVTLWKELVYAEMYLGDYQQALRILTSAEDIARDEVTSEHDIAILYYLRASTLGYMREVDEAIIWLDRAERMFESFGDVKRINRCEAVKASLLMRKGDLGAAARTYQALIPSIRQMDDLHTLGIVYNNLGQVLVRAGKLGEAEEAFNNAITVWHELAMPVEEDRVDWGIGTVRLAAGDFAKAFSIFSNVRQRFLAHQLPVAAGLVGLDAVDALLALGRDDEARQVAELVTQELRDANVGKIVLEALAYLQDLSPKPSRAREVVRHVKSFIAETDHRSSLRFVPLGDE